MLGENGGHGGVVEGEDGDGLAAVDLRGEVGRGQVVVEGGEVRVVRQDAGYVVGRRGRDDGGGGQEEEEEGPDAHCARRSTLFVAGERGCRGRPRRELKLLKRVRGAWLERTSCCGQCSCGRISGHSK